MKPSTKKNSAERRRALARKAAAALPNPEPVPVDEKQDPWRNVR